MHRNFHMIMTGLVAVVLLTVSGTTMARDISLTASVVRVGKVDGEEIVTFHSFTAVTEDTTLTGLSGTYNRTTELFEAFGSSEHRVTAVRTGDDAFEISAAEHLSIVLETEVVAARGDVLYISGETRASSEVLIVDERDLIKAMVAPLIEEWTDAESQRVVLDFFDRTDESDKLVFLKENVIIDQEDSSMRAAWVVFNESETDDMVSAASRDQPLELTITSGSKKEE